MFACMSTDVCEEGRGDERFFDSFFFFFFEDDSFTPWSNLLTGPC